MYELVYICMYVYIYVCIQVRVIEMGWGINCTEWELVFVSTP